MRPEIIFAKFKENLGVIATLLIAEGTLSFAAVCFSEEISAYLKAKTDELKAMTEILNKEKEDDALHHIIVVEVLLLFVSA